jgi:hypothetical protein
MTMEKGGFTEDSQREGAKESLPDILPQQGVKITPDEIRARRELLETHKVAEEEQRTRKQRHAEKMNDEFEIAKKRAEEEWSQTVAETETRLTQGVERLKTMLPALEGKLIGVSEEHYYFGKMPIGQSVDNYQDGYRYADKNYFLGKNISIEYVCKQLAEPDTIDEGGRQWVRRNVPIFDDTVHIYNSRGGIEKYSYFLGSQEIATTDMREKSDLTPGYRDPHGIDEIFGQRVTPEALHQFIQEAEKLVAEESLREGREIEANRPLPEEIQKEIVTIRANEGR